MKKEKLIIIFFVLLIFNIFIVNAVDIILSKSSYQPGETLQAEIKGSFIDDLKFENIQLYRERQIPADLGLFKSSTSYFFYMILPDKEGNYSLVIEDTKHTEKGSLTTNDITQNFTIKLTNESALSINPGFVIASKDFSITVKSLFKTQKITANFDLTNEKKDFELIEDTDKLVKFSLPNTTSTRSNVEVNNYNIPVFIISSESSSFITPVSRISFSPDNINAKITPTSDYSFKINLENTGEVNLTDINITNNLSALITPSFIKSLPINQEIFINLKIPIDKNTKNNISGEIIAKANSKEFKLPIFLEIVNNQSEIALEGTSYTEALSCSDIGISCSPLNETCEGETTASLDGPCCKGTCIILKTETAFTFSWTIGIIIFIIIAAIVGFLFYRYKKNPEKTSDEVLEEKTKLFQKRISPQPSKEVNKGLDRI